MLRSHHQVDFVKDHDCEPQRHTHTQTHTIFRIFIARIAFSRNNFSKKKNIHKQIYTADVLMLVCIIIKIFY